MEKSKTREKCEKIGIDYNCYTSWCRKHNKDIKDIKNISIYKKNINARQNFYKVQGKSYASLKKACDALNIKYGGYINWCIKNKKDSKDLKNVKEYQKSLQKYLYKNKYYSSINAICWEYDIDYKLYQIYCKRNNTQIQNTQNIDLYINERKEKYGEY